MDILPSSPSMQETYQDFLLARGPARARQLSVIGLTATVALFVLDVMHAWVGLGGPRDVGLVVLARLPWALVPLMMLSLRGLISLESLPNALYWASLAFAIGNEWTFYQLGTAGTLYHGVFVLLNVLTGPSVLPVGRAGRFGFYALLGLAHLTLDALLPGDKADPSVRLAHTLPALALGAATGAIFAIDQDALPTGRRPTSVASE